MVQLLDVPVRVGLLVEVLRLIDTVVPEQVVDMLKITSQDVIPQRAVLRAPQMAEQLVDEPVPSFDDFKLVEVGEEEEEQPHMVPETRVWDAESPSGQPRIGCVRRLRFLDLESMRFLGVVVAKVS